MFKQPMKDFRTCEVCGVRDYSEFMSTMHMLNYETYCLECATDFNHDHCLYYDQSAVERKRKWRFAYHSGEVQL